MMAAIVCYRPSEWAGNRYKKCRSRNSIAPQCCSLNDIICNFICKIGCENKSEYDNEIRRIGEIIQCPGHNLFYIALFNFLSNIHISVFHINLGQDHTHIYLYCLSIAYFIRRLVTENKPNLKDNLT